MKLKTRLEERDGQTVFVINRPEWMRGEPYNTFLWNGKRGCCLGLAAIVEGVELSALKGESEPAAIRYAAPSPYCDAWTRGDDELPRNSVAAHDAMTFNDAKARDEQEEADRESALAVVFKDARGWLVEFED